MYIKKYPLEFITKIIKHGIHIILLNPFHIYSDHNFKSGEIYYFSDKHDELVKYRIFLHTNYLFNLFIWLVLSL